MDYSDTTVIIPVKDEPAVSQVARDVVKKLPGAKALVIYKGDKPDIKFRDGNLEVVKQKGSGKGVACVQAVEMVDRDIVCFIDGDATYDVNDLKKVITMVRNGVDLAMGDRLSRLDREAMPLFIEVGNRVLTVTANMLYGLSIKDSQTGLRAIRKEVFESLDLKEPHFGIETEINVKARKKRLKIVETQINYYKRIGESKQMKLIDGFRLLWIACKFMLA